MKYQIAQHGRRLCEVFGCDPSRVALRAGLPADFFGSGERPVSASEFYDLWDALDAEIADPELPLRMAEAVLEDGFDSAIYAFFSSPSVRIGLTRKTLFKPLIAPLSMSVAAEGEGLAAAFASTVPGRPLPQLLGWFDLVFFVLAIRRATGVHVVPAHVRVAAPRAGWTGAADLFEVPPQDADTYSLVLRAEDADRPLVSRNDALWAELERSLQQRFGMHPAPRSLTARVRQALVDGLPGGQGSAAQIASALAMSKRSLQRRLSEEGASFKDILEDTRRALALNYLQNTDMSVQEIAFLLGFRDPTSFFRAFRGWTGKTPQAVRNVSES